MTGERLSARGLVHLRARLSDRDVAVVRDVATLKLMGARQIEALHFRVSDHATPLTAARTCRRVLERLVSERLLVRLNRRIGGMRAGSASYVYGLGPVGYRLVESRNVRRRFAEPTATFVDHTLAIVDVVVEVRQAMSTGEIVGAEIEAEPTCWRSLTGDGVRLLRPDLFVAIEIGEFEYRTFVEIDLGTESIPRLLAKCELYESYYRTGIEQRNHDVFPKVIWLMDDATRAATFQTAMRRRIATPELFVVTTQRTWQTVANVVDEIDS